MFALDSHSLSPWRIIVVHLGICYAANQIWTIVVIGHKAVTVWLTWCPTTIGKGSWAGGRPLTHPPSSHITALPSQFCRQLMLS